MSAYRNSLCGLPGWAMALALLAGLLVAGGAVQAQTPKTTNPQGPAETIPPDVRDLISLLNKPTVRDWLTRQGLQPVTQPDAKPTEDKAKLQALVADRLAAVRDQLIALGKALPRLPGELERVWRNLSRELEQGGILSTVTLIAAFAGLGFALERLFWRVTAHARQRIIDAEFDTVRQRLRIVLVRFAYGIGIETLFAAGSIGAFLLFDWPPLLREIAVGYLLAFLLLRLAFVLGRWLLSPTIEHLRIVPMPTKAAYYWDNWLAALTGWCAFTWATLGLLRTLGLDPDASRLVASALGLVLLVMGLIVAWTRPRGGDSDTTKPRSQHSLHDEPAWLLSAYFVLLWLLWVAGAPPLFSLGVVAVGLPLAIGVSERAVDHVLRPTDHIEGASVAPSVTAATHRRILRLTFIIGAALFLAWAWGIDLTEITQGDSLATRLMRGLLNAALILLLADLAWHLVATWIDRKIYEAGDSSEVEGKETQRQSRLRTLLPILRNVLLIVLLTIAVLMALSSLGFEIGPLIAGAGVVGLAVGFGAQTLVKDIINGVFYLLDDAFRVGEYIQSGKYKGTVESFSLRSVKLRHHRGALYTVPFGELGTVENMSRDWVIDKMTIGVTYDTDIEKVKKIVKRISAELANEPEFASQFIEPLKMQGIDQFGDFAVQLRIKMKTKPNEQFVIRRRAYAMIKKAFDENGIQFAYPTVQVAGGGPATPAVAQQAIDLTRPEQATN